MGRECHDCGRVNGGHRESCVYCGVDLPPGDPADLPVARSLPPDLDQLIARAMAQGNVAALEAALKEHQSAGPAQDTQAPVTTPATRTSVQAGPTAPAPTQPRPPSPVQNPERPQHPPISIADTLAELGEGLDDARLAWIGGDVSAVRGWAHKAQPVLEAVLDQLDREAAEETAQLSLLPAASVDVAPSEPAVGVAPPSVPQAPLEPEPADPSGDIAPTVPPVQSTILMPKVRHSMALFVEGMGDAERSAELAEALNVDGVTARLISVSRYPRCVFRGEDEVRMTQSAERVRSDLGIRAALVSREAMLAIGPAVAVTQAITADPLRLEIVDRAMWDVDLKSQPGVDPREVAPTLRLAVVGEIVVHRFRTMPQGGRLKHIRETRVQGAGEDRLAVVDLHTDDGILRVVEGATDLGGFPGHTPSAAVRSLRDFVAHLETLVPVMPRRVCQPGLDRPGGGAVAGQSGTSQDTGWAAFEEHSRACRLLFGLPTPG